MTRAWRRDKPLTIRHRLLVSFLVIIFLFFLNITFFYFSNERLAVSVKELRDAIQAQTYMGEIQQALDNTQKQVTLMSESVTDSAGSLDEFQQFEKQLNDLGQKISDMAKVSSGDAEGQSKSLKVKYADLQTSWMEFYKNFGVDHTKAIIELATSAEPKGQEIQLKIIPDLLKAQKQNVDLTQANFVRTSDFARNISLFLFLISSAIAIVIAYRLSHYLSTRLGDLKLGAALIGSGRLHNRIEIKPQDELGDLANAFNSMAENLDHARSELTAANEELESKNEQVERQRQMSESLLLNILPEDIAHELRENEVVEPKYFEDVSILFTDFVGFTLSTEKLAAENLVYLLNDYFTAFDNIASRYGIEKMKTIGDSYMCVSGMPRRNPAHPVDMVMAAFEMLHAVEELGKKPGAPDWRVRIGIHTGPVIAGVVGIKKFAFDVWGESVNYSSRMESSGAPNRINLSERTHSRVKDFFICENRGKVLTKDKREVDMYFVEGILPELLDGSLDTTPAPFARRYHIYFQEQPPSFPAFLLEQAARVS